MTHGQRLCDTCGEEDATTARGDLAVCGRTPGRRARAAGRSSLILSSSRPGTTRTSTSNAAPSADICGMRHARGATLPCMRRFVRAYRKVGENGVRKSGLAHLPRLAGRDQRLSHAPCFVAAKLWME